MSGRKKYTNMAGVAVLGFFVIAMICVSGSKWLSSRSEVRETEKQLNRVAEGFANNDREIILQWASGEHPDLWGNQFVPKSVKGGYRFVSKGPDGELGTEDDIVGRVYKPTIKKRVQNVFVKKPHVEKKTEELEEKPHDPSTIDKAKGWWKRMRSKDE